ncbi:MAG: hypothetical protein ACQESQ_12910 [Bacteroidota bacterium]
MKIFLIFIMALGFYSFTIGQTVIYKGKQYEIELPKQFARYKKYDNQMFEGYKSIAGIDSIGSYYDYFLTGTAGLSVRYYEKSEISKSESRKLLSVLYPDADFITVLRNEDVTYYNKSGKLIKTKTEAGKGRVGYNLNLYFIAGNGICHITLVSDKKEILEKYEQRNFLNKIKFREK